MTLSPEEEAKLVQFKEVTDFSDADRDKVVRLLSVCNWDLDNACVRYFDNDFPTLIEDQPMDTRNTERPPPADLPPELAQLMPKLPRATTIPNTWRYDVGLLGANRARQGGISVFAPIYFVMMLFPRVFWAIGWGLNRVFGPLFPNVFRFLGYRKTPSDLPLKPVHVTKEEVASYSVKCWLEEMLGESTDLDVYRGEFNEAFNLAKRDHRWLLCVLANSEAEPSKTFVKQWLNDSRLQELTTDYNVILYIGDVAYPEPFEVAKVYRARSIPHMSLIANVSSSGLTAPSMSVVYQSQNFHTDAKTSAEGKRRTFKKLGRVLERYEPQLVVQRAEKAEADFSRVLREQQDSAYQESLYKDKKKQEDKKRKQEEQRKIQEEAELKERTYNAALYRYFQSKYNRDDSNWPKGEYTRIQLRNQDGQRVICKFSKDDTTADVFMFVECWNFVEEQGQDAVEKLQDDPSLNEVSVNFAFDLVSPMPRLRLEPSATRLEEVKQLWPNGSLLIERKEGSGSENESDDESDEIN